MHTGIIQREGVLSMALMWWPTSSPRSCDFHDTWPSLHHLIVPDLTDREFCFPEFFSSILQLCKLPGWQQTLSEQWNFFESQSKGYFFKPMDHFHSDQISFLKALVFSCSWEYASPFHCILVAACLQLHKRYHLPSMDALAKLQELVVSSYGYLPTSAVAQKWLPWLLILSFLSSR